MSTNFQSPQSSPEGHHGPGEMECTDALERMFLFLDNEMSDSDSARIRQHLAECEPCLERYDVEGLVKNLVHRACGCDKPPEELRQKVMMRIRQVQVQFTRLPEV